MPATLSQAEQAQLSALLEKLLAGLAERASASDGP